MPKAVVSGYHSFIASHLIKRLEHEKMEVVKVERQKLYDGNFDYWFHLSTYGNHYNQKDLIQTVNINIQYLLAILESIKKKKFISFVNFSSSSVTLPVPTLYSETKRLGEYLCNLYRRDYGLPIINIRPYSVYGPGEADFRFIPTLIINGLKGDKSKVSLGARHDWLYIEDFIEAVYLISRNPKIDQPVAIGRGLSSSNGEVAVTVNEVFKQYDDNYKEIFYDYTSSMRDYDTDKWVANSNVLRLLGWTDKFSLHDGLVETYKYYKKRYDRLGKTDNLNIL